VRNLILGSGCQIEKFYLINNTGTGAKTVKNTSGTGISVPAGKATLVYNNGTNVVDAASYFTSLTLGSALPVASGGTGTTSTTFANLTTNVTGILPVANGGTATATPALVQGTGVTITGTWPNQTINATGTGGTVTSVAGTGTVNGISLSGTVTTSGSLTLGGTLSGVNLTSQVTGTLPIANGGTGTTSTTFANLTTNVTGTLPVANGGTGAATLTANNVVLGNGTSAPLFVAPSTTGNVLTSNGSTWQSTAPAGGGAWTFLSTVTASGAATADVETTFNSTYDMYAIVVTGLTPSSTVSGWYSRLKVGGSYDTTNYSYNQLYLIANSLTVATRATTNGSFIQIGRGAEDTNSFSSFVIYVPNPSSTSVKKTIYWTGFSQYNDVMNTYMGSGMYTGSTSALTGVQIYASSGNLTGTFRLYGIKNS
jgi:hypothetical protein